MQEISTKAKQGFSDSDGSAYPESRHINDVLPQSMYIVDSDGRMLRWSPWFRERIAGLSDDMLGTIHFLELVHPDDRALIGQRMQTIFSQGGEESVEARILLKGGPAFRWFLFIANRYERNGKPCIIGTGIDITHLKKAGMALMLSEQRFRSMFEQADAPVFITGIDGRIVYVSPAFETISGYPFQECHGKPFMQLFDEKSGSRAAQSMLADVLANPSTIRKHEFRICKKDGSSGYVEVKLQRYHDNRTEGTIGVLYDLTLRKRLESLTEFRLGMLQQAEMLTIEEIMKSTLDEAEMLTDSTFGFICFLTEESLNWSRCIVSARSGERLNELNRSGAPHPFDVMPFIREVIRTHRTVIIDHYDTPAHSGFPSGHPEVINSLAVPFIENGQVTAVLLVFNKPSSYNETDAQWAGTLVDLARDIIVRKKKEQSETRIQSILLQIQKMEMIGQLAGGIAHDFNNMLGVILGNAELALSSDDLDPAVEENLQEIYRAAERSAEMTSQLLAFARKQTAVPRVIDIDEAIREALPILRRVAGEKIELDWHPYGTESKVRIDPSQFDQILMNFCLNARDAMNGSGKIVIESKVEHIEATPDHGTHFGLSGDYIMISVTDTGQGIPDKNKLHIFEPFFTTKAMGKGTGLGLSSVYGLVKQNRGFVDFESKEGVGSTFRAFLPLLKARYVVPMVESSVVPAFSGQATILVVEDEPEILNLCRMMLEKSGYTVFAAACPSEAIMIAEERSGKIDLLLTDIVMPEMNGTDLSMKLSTISPGFRVLFMSGYSADIIANHGVPNPVVNVIRKPFTFKALADKVRQTLDVE
jgi:PAS domain S-box-containing protein